MSDPRIFFSAGETSGDLHGAALAQALRERFPEAEMYGLAGPRMARAGVEPLVEFDRLPVTGLVEVLPRIPFFLRLRGTVRRALRDRRPDLAVPIDYPGFNMWFAGEAHRRGVAVLVYIAPQVWAWRRGRTRRLAEHADRVAVVFPQEESFLREHGVEARFVGHPLVDRLSEWPGAEEARRRAGCDPDRPVLGLLPGSREQEVRRHLRAFTEVARAIVRERPEVQVRIARAPDLPPTLFESDPLFSVVDDSRVVLRAATAVLTKAGTSTVEAALAGTPLVVAHRVHPVTFTLARRLVHVDSIAMVNLLAGRRIVPEFVQELPIETIAGELRPLLSPGDPDRERMIAALREVRDRLGPEGAARRTAELAAELLDGRR